VDQQRAFAKQAHAGGQRAELIGWLFARQEFQRRAGDVHMQAATIEQPNAELIPIAVVVVGHVQPSFRLGAPNSSSSELTSSGSSWCSQCEARGSRTTWPSRQ
jgi:hypothetical protein